MATASTPEQDRQFLVASTYHLVLKWRFENGFRGARTRGLTGGAVNGCQGPSLMPSMRAISLLLMPCASTATICRRRAVDSLMRASPIQRAHRQSGAARCCRPVAAQCSRLGVRRRDRVRIAHVDGEAVQQMEKYSCCHGLGSRSSGLHRHRRDARMHRRRIRSSA